MRVRTVRPWEYEPPIMLGHVTLIPDEEKQFGESAHHSRCRRADCVRFAEHMEHDA